MNRFRLKFLLYQSGIMLYETIFWCKENNVPRRCRRGHVSELKPYPHFQWSAEIKAFSILFFEHLISDLSLDKQACIKCESGRVAGDLCQVIRQGAGWLEQMFGRATCGNSYFQQILHFAHSEDQEVEVPLLKVNEVLLPPNCIEIFVDNCHIKEVKLLKHYLSLLKNS